MHQKWEDLLFLHWQVDAPQLQRTLPAGLHVDTFDGKAWVGMTPFFMRGVRMRFMPSLPCISAFLETNVRTYVYDDHGRSGVWFYSLDCNQTLAVLAARATLSLPYRNAAMSAHVRGDGYLCYQTKRDGDAHESRFVYRLEPGGDPAQAGSLEFFLTERYLLFTQTPLGLAWLQVHHRPYPLTKADLLEWDSRLLALDGLGTFSRQPDHVIGSPGVQVKIYPPAMV